MRIIKSMSAELNMPQTITVKHPLFRLLVSEHAKISSRLHSVDPATVTRDDIEWFWQYAETDHHQREEKILFNYLLNDPRVDGGGPMCMLYMDCYIMRPPLDRAKAVTGVLPPLEPHQIQIFEQGSAMRIPVNEHRAGKDILRFMLEKWNDLEPAKRRKCFEEYRSLQLENIQKEENCFFFMCASLLNLEEADELFNLMNTV